MPDCISCRSFIKGTTTLGASSLIAGVGRVAIDANGGRLIGVNPEEVSMIRMAQEHGLGESRLDRLLIHEAIL